MSTPRSRKLLEETRKIMRLRHYSIHTERAYCDWIKRYVRYHGMTGRGDLKNGEAKIEAFLTHLAMDTDVAPSTQIRADKTNKRAHVPTQFRHSSSSAWHRY